MWRGRLDPRRVRLYALVAVVACAFALPLAVASAGQVGDRGGVGAPSAVRLQPSGDDKMPSAEPGLPRSSGTPTPALLGLGLATAARCGPEVSSPEGVEAQTCVLTQGTESWGRTYYRNASGEPLDAALTFMGPGDRTVQTHCALDGDDEPGTCETPREHTRGLPTAYSAVAEFAGQDGSNEHGGRGPLLLRSGSNSPERTGG
ncbi:hypothetical protein [Streptomyces sp. NRRL S-813]|uniref:hypothetical protein n=1 Tax=Streptomyces sp. NRRL S-813 TaxID=1463919 RepID=UPI000AF6F9D9|nr:hypothetical protein [Streptomyces sp. NRRL S-813]